LTFSVSASTPPRCKSGLSLTRLPLYQQLQRNPLTLKDISIPSLGYAEILP
jgi:hypothetical protein